MKYSDLFQKYSPELLHNEPRFWKEFKGEFISFDKDKEIQGLKNEIQQL